MFMFDALILGVLQAFQAVPFFVLSDLLGGIVGLFGGVLLLIIGVIVIIFVVAAAIVVLPAILVAFLVWLLTGSFFFAGVAFLAVALISIVAIADE
jgi:hypothetical protein